MTDMQKDDPARYEFRVWGNDLRDVLARLTDLAEPGAVEESVETYLLPRRLNAFTVKLRDGRLDIKERTEIREGLERWRPLSKRAFPLGSDVLHRELAPALSLPSGALPREVRNDNELIEILASAELRVDTVRLTKHRCHFAWDDVLGEHVEVACLGGTLWSVAVESADAYAVLRAVRKLGLEGMENRSYSSAIRAALDGRDTGGPARV
jgi:hypothetical protein